jgi:D-glycero-alpha-D-manno-heptose-7-phosphate kinase
MIVSRTPLRISLVGGATDLPEFYTKNDYGAVVSFAIKHHFTVVANKRFERNIRLSYSDTEIVDNPLDLKHDIVRACLMRMRIKYGIEINTISDIPGSGTGLGSSSALTVGLLNALSQYALTQNIEHSSFEDVADEAYGIERDVLGRRLGKQDHYACAYGGMNYIRFNADGSVKVQPMPKYNEFYEKVLRRISVFYTGITRSSQGILQEQSKNTANDSRAVDKLIKMRDLADQVYGLIMTENYDEVGEALDLNWQLKKELAKNISSYEIDNWYDIGKSNGAIGAKICGAGGGGFLLFWSRPEDKEKIQQAMPLRYVPIRIEPRGTHIAYMEGFND